MALSAGADTAAGPATPAGVEMLLAEGFIEGCLSMLDAHLEMDAVVSRQKN